MARKYKFHDNSKLYFVTFTVVNWIDAFIRDDYRKIFYESVAVEIIMAIEKEQLT